MHAMGAKGLPLNSAARNAVWVYPRAPQCPDLLSLPEGADVTVELYGGACSLWLDGTRRRVHVRRFDYASFPTEEEARHAFMRLWREGERVGGPARVGETG